MDEPEPVDIGKVREFLAQKEQRRKRKLDAQFEQARQDFERIVEHIIATYRPVHIYQWGSLLERRHFSEISDIDIALEGLRGPEEYFAILGDAMKMTRFPLDIIEIDKISKEHADSIREKGRLIYERHSQT